MIDRGDEMGSGETETERAGEPPPPPNSADEPQLGRMGKRQKGDRKEGTEPLPRFTDRRRLEEESKVPPRREQMDERQTEGQQREGRRR